MAVRVPIAVFLPPILALATLLSLLKPPAKTDEMSVHAILVAGIGAQSFGYLLDPVGGLVAGILFVAIVLLLRRASSGGPSSGLPGRSVSSHWPWSSWARSG